MKNNTTTIQRQLLEFETSPPEERQSFYDKTRSPEQLKAQLIELNIPVESATIDCKDFNKWRKSFPGMNDYYKNSGDVFIEKLLEHYLSYTYLNIREKKVVIDIAAAGSPWSDILYESGIDSYRLDLKYDNGIHGRQIGGDAGNTTLPNNFADSLTLHCAYECFQNDSDQKFVREAERILKINGNFGILPLYLDEIYNILTSPYCNQNEVMIDSSAKRVWREDIYKEPFSRHYSPKAFYERIFCNLNTIQGKIIFFDNIDEITRNWQDQRIYCHFLFMGVKKGN